MRAAIPQSQRTSVQQSSPAPALSAAEVDLVTYLRRRAAEGSGARARTGWPHGSQYDLLLTYGRLFTPAELPTGFGRKFPTFCFSNAAEAVDENEHLGLVYVEGYAAFTLDGQSFPTPHGWTARPDGRVLDPTWPHEPDLAYVGIPITAPHLVASAALGVSVLQDIGSQRQLLQYGFAPGAVADVGRPIPPLD